MKKRILKRFISLVILSALFMTSGLFAFADSETTFKNSHIKLEKVINTYKTERETTYTIDKAKQLSGLSGVEYTLYTLLPYGYAVVHNDSATIMEACYREYAVVPIDVNSSIDYYYGGLFTYCVENEKGLLNIRSNAYLTQASIDSLIKSETNVVATLDDDFCISEIEADGVTTLTTEATDATTYTVKPSYFSSLMEYGYNDDNTCTIVAATILLSYFDTYRNSKYISSVYEETATVGHGVKESFHDYLVEYIYGDTVTNTNLITLSAGVSEYLATQGMCKSMYTSSDTSLSSNDVFKEIEAQLSAGYPAIGGADFVIGNVSGAHAFVVYGVTYTEKKSTKAYYTVNMGWDSKYNTTQTVTSPSGYSEYVISATNVYDFAYITDVSHTYNWVDYNSMYHRGTCSVCGDVITESHADYWNSVLGKCRRCGRTSPIIVNSTSHEISIFTNYDSIGAE